RGTGLLPPPAFGLRPGMLLVRHRPPRSLSLADVSPGRLTLLLGRHDSPPFRMRSDGQAGPINAPRGTTPVPTVLVSACAAVRRHREPPPRLPDRCALRVPNPGKTPGRRETELGRATAPRGGAWPSMGSSVGPFATR